MFICLLYESQKNICTSITEYIFSELPFFAARSPKAEVKGVLYRTGGKTYIFYYTYTYILKLKIILKQILLLCNHYSILHIIDGIS